MSHIATTDFLVRLKGLYPDSRRATLHSRWYLLAAVAFSAGNIPEVVPIIFEFVLKELEAQKSRSKDDTHAVRLLLARRMRDCIFRAGMLNGYARTINSLVALSEVTPDDLRDTETLRNTNQAIQQYAEDGRELFQSMYTDDATRVQDLLDTIHPDMGWFSNTVAYGMVYGGSNVLSQVEVSLIMAVVNTVMDTPQQAGWHFKNAMSGGVSLEEVEAARSLAMEAVSKCDIVLRRTK
ncbi:hypothetical protein BXZ70DRAFT_938449 [Cristinia sonorae]|uniref:Carboxymuconolactone decarboxylase n=1 Tax=Cristinia sonorae TaxID=1940300 RepID=A0A8K0UPZ8_9AGAR|nr:hypothetical protein BXZ70DRAFT_938449 [Cristinia sonorae]